MQLRHDDPLRAIDDKCAKRREYREVTEIHFLLDDVLGPPLVLEFFPYDQPESSLQGRGIRHVALHALFHVVLRLAQRVADKLELEVPVYVGDREDFIEHPLESDVLPLASGGIGLEKGFERSQLHV